MVMGTAGAVRERTSRRPVFVQQKGCIQMKFQQYDLRGESIEAVSGSLQAYLKDIGTERLNLQRIRLTVEELLLRVQKHYGGETLVSVGIGRHFGRHFFRLRYEGDPFDPTESREDEWNDRILTALGLSPAWSYRGKVNTVSLELAQRTKHGPLFNIAAAVLAAVIVGTAGYLLSAQTREILTELLLTPLVSCYFGLMGTFSGIMIALTICSGILGVGDSATLSRMGKKTIIRFISSMFLVSAAVVLICIFLFRLPFAGSLQQDVSQWGDITRMLFDIFPADPIDPFLKGNTIQIIVIAVFVGVGVISMGERGIRLRDMIGDAAVLTQQITSFICSFVPLSVFVMLVREIWSGHVSELLTLWKPFLTIILGGYVLMLLSTLLTSLLVRCSPVLLLKKALPPYVVAFTSASSMAAMTLGMETCEKKLGADGNFVKFAYPLGSVLYMPCSVMSFAVIGCAMASVFNVQINPSWVITAMITVTLLVIAMPPIPGAGIIVYTIIFSRLGIPAEALVLAAAIDVVVDFFNTGGNIFLLIMHLTGESKAQHLMDSSVLRKKC